METVIWLTEVAPQLGREERLILDHLDVTSEEANPSLARLALKLATGAGKTTVMAMIIAWQTVNVVRRPGSRKSTRGFPVVTPGITIRDRLRVLQPNDPDSYHGSRELVPGDMLRDLGDPSQRHLAPFDRSQSGRIVVKAVNHLGDEVMKWMRWANDRLKRWVWTRPISWQEREPSSVSPIGILLKEWPHVDVNAGRGMLSCHVCRVGELSRQKRKRE